MKNSISLINFDRFILTFTNFNISLQISYYYLILHRYYYLILHRIAIYHQVSSF